MLSVCLYCKRKRWMKPWRWSKTTITCTGHQTVQSWFSKKCQFLKCSFFQAVASALSEDNHAERRAVAVENEGGEAAPLSCTCFCSFYRPRAPDCSVVRRSTSTVEHPARMSCGPELALREFAPSYQRATIMQVPVAV